MVEADTRMKWRRPRSADSGLVTVLLVSDAELAMLVQATRSRANEATAVDAAQWKKLKAELETARKAL